MQPLTTLLILLLLLTGIIGGGFGIREFKLPWAGPGVRATAVVASLLLWFAGSAIPQYLRVKFSVINRLSPDLLTEKAVLYINDQEVGSLESSTTQPISTAEFSIEEAGTFSYSLDITVTYINSVNGQEETYNGTGTGTIEVKPDEVFSLEKEYLNSGEPRFYLTAE